MLYCVSKFLLLNHIQVVFTTISDRQKGGQVMKSIIVVKKTVYDQLKGIFINNIAFIHYQKVQ